MTKNTAPATWNTLLENALVEPGKVAACYRAFHNYSIGNQLLAMWQCEAREIPIGPMATYKAWDSKGRQVRKGEKAITMCVPNMVTRKNKETGEKESFITGFSYRARWFTIAQTDGTDAELDTVPGWDWDTACAKLGITRIPYASANGNSQGYSKGNGQVAINPVAAHASRTMLHEMAHSLLHPVGCGVDRATAELEAEAVSYLLAATFNLPGMAESRGYMQNWYCYGEVPEAVASRIFTAANKILKAGQ